MSGGYFDYKQHHLTEMYRELQRAIDADQEPDMTLYGWERGEKYKPETIAEFKTALDLLARAAVYMQRIDWLLSSDDSEETFHKRLKADLEKI